MVYRPDLGEQKHHEHGDEGDGVHNPLSGQVYDHPVSFYIRHGVGPS
jgi:hypothetical protein